MNPRPARSQLLLLLLPVASGRDWPQVRRYRLVRLRDRSLPEKVDSRGASQAPPGE